MKTSFAAKTSLICALALAVGSPAFAKKAPAPPPGPPPPKGPVDADWRTPDPENVLVIDTSKGRIVIELQPAVAPASVAQIRDLARAHFYDGLSFFRVIDGFMDQTGDPKNDGTGQSDKPNLPPEFTFRRGSDTPLTVIDKTNGSEWGYIGSLPVVSQTLDLALITADHKVAAYGAFCSGVVGLARADDPNSANSQFFLMRGPTAQLNHQYTAFASTIAGLDVIRAIKTGAAGTGAVTAPPDTMTSVRVLADIPPAERPKVRVLDPAGAWFKVLVDKVRNEKLIGFTVCDVDLPGEVK